MRGFCASAIAIHTRWRCPPDRSPTGRSASSVTRSPHGLVHPLGVGGIPALEDAAVGVTAAGDELGDGQPVGRGRMLRQQADGLCEAAAGMVETSSRPVRPLPPADC